MKNENIELFLSEDFDLTNVDDVSIDDNDDVDTSSLLSDLEQIMSPILIKSQLDSVNGLSEQLMEACSEDHIYESNLIKLDKDSMMAQLKAICTLLVARKKNTTAWQLYQKSSKVKKDSKLQMQEEEAVAGSRLAEEYLNKIRSTGNSGLLRSAAEHLSD